MNRFEQFLLTLFFVELFVGGGGRLIDFGILSIRQVLFLLILATFVFRLVRNKQLLDRNANTFLSINPTSVAVYLLVAWFGVSVLVGIVNGNAISVIAKDFLRVTFFLLYFPLVYYIAEERYQKGKIIGLLKVSSLVVATFTILISLVGKFVFVHNFVSFYDFINSVMNDDLFFRPSRSVFYKGHFFVLMGLFLSLNAVLSKQGTKIDIINIAVCLISLVWSETRGFLLAIMFGLLFIVMVDMKVFTDGAHGIQQKVAKLRSSKFMMRKILVSLLIVAIVPFLYKYMTMERFGSESAPQQPIHSPNENVEQKVNDVSVNSRLEFILASKDLVFTKISTFVVGSGYGTEIAGRDTGIEMSFLDILVEQGVIGLILWLYVSLMVFYNFYHIYRKQGSLEMTDISMLACIAALLLLTNINPFINNPLGIGFLLTVLVLSKNKKDALQKTA